VHPFAVGVIVIVPLIGVLPELVVVKDAIGLPEPLAARPIDVLLLVHVNVDPDTGPVIVVELDVTPVQ